MSLNTDELKRQIKEMMVAELMLQQNAGEIADDVAIFRPEGLGLDSVDALQLVVALEKKFGLKLPNADVAKNVLRDVNSITAAIVSKTQQPPSSPCTT